MDNNLRKEIEVLKCSLPKIEKKFNSAKAKLCELERRLMVDELNEKLNQINNDPRYTFKAPKTPKEAKETGRRIANMFLEDMDNFLKGFNGKKLPSVNSLVNPSVNDGKDAVNHPSHYKSENGMECIDAMTIESVRLAKKKISPIQSFCYLNAFKYEWRKDDKGNAKQDVDKAKWYIGKYNEYAGVTSDECITYEYIQKRVAKYKRCE